MALTARDLMMMATRYRSDFQVATEAIRSATYGNGRQLHLVSEAIRSATYGNGRQLHLVSEAVRAVAAEAARGQLQNMAPEVALPQQVAPSDFSPAMGQFPIGQLVLHAMITVLIATVVIAYMDAKLTTEPEEALLNFLFAFWFWYEVHSEFWNWPE